MGFLFTNLVKRTNCTSGPFGSINCWFSILGLNSSLEFEDPNNSKNETKYFSLV